MTPHFATAPRRLAPLALAATLALLAGCSALDSSGDRVDYRNQVGKSQPLDVPPDLTQLARENRYQPQGGAVVSANAMRQPPAAAAAAAPSNVKVPVAPASVGDNRIERQGNTRWLVSKLTPEQIYPIVRAFWLERGFVLVQDSPTAGMLQTEWAENKAKLPNDIIRNTIGRVFERVFDTGERDMFRTRVERTAEGSEVYISHRGLAEVKVDTRGDQFRWMARPSDPMLEAEMLSRLLLRLGGAADEPAARAAVEQAPSAAPRAQPAPGADGPVQMDIAEGFDRAWRQVGLALDRGGFTVEDRDRSAGLYFVRYIDPKYAGQEEPNFFAKLFGADDASKRVQRLRVVVKASGDKSRVSVQNADGVPETGDAARRVIGRLIDELR